MLFNSRLKFSFCGHCLHECYTDGDYVVFRSIAHAPRQRVSGGNYRSNCSVQK